MLKLTRYNSLIKCCWRFNGKANIHKYFTQICGYVFTFMKNTIILFGEHTIEKPSSYLQVSRRCKENNVPFNCDQLPVQNSEF